MKKLVLLVALLAFVVSVPMAMAADAPKAAAAAQVCCKDKKVDATAKDAAACAKAGGKWVDAKDCK
jgi:Ni/Co efflux regulator RcnB